MFLTNIFFPTKHNKYTPHIFSKKVFSIIVALLFFFNVVASYNADLSYHPSAGSININSLIALANQARASEGLVALTYDGRLSTSANNKASDMFARQYWAHNCPCGGAAWNTFIINTGYSYQTAGENLGKGFNDSGSLHNAWMNSPTHRANIMNPAFRNIGMAAQDGTLLGEQVTLVVQHFGTLVGYTDPEPEPEPTPEPVTAPAPVQEAPAPTTPQANNAGTPVAVQPSSTQPAKVQPVVARPVSKAVVISSSSKQTLSSPTIDNPEKDLITNQDSIKLHGQADGRTVKIYNNSSEIAEAQINNSTWEYNPAITADQNEYSVKSFENDLVSAESNKLKITLDKLTPILSLDQVALTPVYPNYSTTEAISVIDTFDIKIPIQENYSLSSVEVIKSEGNSKITPNITDKFIQFEYKLNQPYLVNLKITDIAGNSVDTEITQDFLDSAIFAYYEKNNNAELAQTYTADGADTIQETLKEMYLNYMSMSIKQHVNIFFAIAISLLLLIDAYILYKKHLPISRAFSLLHIPQIIGLILFALIGGFGSIF